MVPETEHERALRIVAEMDRRIGAATSRRKLAQALGWGASHMSHVLNYRRPIKLSEFLAICGALAVDPIEVMATALGLPRPPTPPAPEQALQRIVYVPAQTSAPSLGEELLELEARMKETLESRLEQLGYAREPAPKKAGQKTTKGKAHG